MVRQDLIRSARKYAAQSDGTHGLTVWSWRGMTAGDIALRVKQTHPVGTNPVAHRKLRQSTAGTIREPARDGRSFGLLKTGTDGHYTLTFPSEPTEADWKRLEGMFRAPEPNPAAD